MDGKPGVKKGIGSINKPSSDEERTLLRIVMEERFCQDIFKWKVRQVHKTEYHAIAVKFPQLTVSLVFFCMLALYLAYVTYVNFFLLWVDRPWDRNVWNGVRVAAIEVLVQGKVRDKTR